MAANSIGVLVVESNAGDARMVREALKGPSEPNYRVECVERLPHALARLAEGGVDVLLLGLNVPDSSGLEALPEIRAVAPGVPVVALSEDDNEQLAVEAVQRGAQDFLVKSHADRSLLTRSMRYAIERKRIEEALEQANSKLQQLSRDLLRTQDYERRRIARELHDSTSQLLAGLGINLSRLKDPGLAPDRRSQALAEACELADACSTEIRTVTYLLHPPLLDEVGLVSALHAYAQGFSHRTGIEVGIETSPGLGRLNPEMESALFRIVQEGLANVHRHSGSSSAAIRLERGADGVRLDLQDRGRGFSQQPRTPAKGFVRFGVGIMGMRERAEQLGGRLELASDGGGAKLSVTLPLAECYEENTHIAGR